MKNYILKAAAIATITTGVLTNLQADSFAEISIGQLIAQEKNVLGSQPISELVGGNSQVYTLKYGLEGHKKIGARAFVYSDIAPERNEFIFGIGGELVNKFDFNSDFFYRLGAKVGYGWQSVKGRTAQASTSATKVSYITDTVDLTPTTIKYEEDTAIISVGLNVGFDYKISENLKLSTDFTYRRDDMQVAYRNQNDTGNVLNAMSFNQDNYIASIGLNYTF